MPNEIEIDLKLGKSTLFEYQTTAVPRIGEIMAINVDDYIGTFEVVNVAHNVFKEKQSGKIYSYVTVYLERPKGIDPTE